jgi:hypothetical protein
MVIAVGSARIEVETVALAFPKTSGRFNGWLGYALARRIWIDSKFSKRFINESRYQYTYDEELDARESASKIWSELAAKEHFDDRYFADLGRIEDAGFMREYVWFCVPHPAWIKPAGLREADFAAWLSSSLPSHVVETWVSATPMPRPEHVVLGREAHRPMRCQAPGTMTPPPSLTGV